MGFKVAWDSSDSNSFSVTFEFIASAWTTLRGEGGTGTGSSEGTTGGTSACGSGESHRSTRRVTLAGSGDGVDEMEGLVWDLGVLLLGGVMWTGLRGSEGGAVMLEVRVVLSLTGLLWLRSKVSVTVSELVGTERGKSTTAAAVSVTCLWEEGENRDTDGWCRHRGETLRERHQIIACMWLQHICNTHLKCSIACITRVVLQVMVTRGSTWFKIRKMVGKNVCYGGSI